LGQSRGKAGLAGTDRAFDQENVSIDPARHLLTPNGSPIWVAGTFCALGRKSQQDPNKIPEIFQRDSCQP
jgi:hypothetical protein